MPGGGAEIFAPRVRRKICDDKATAEQWLEIHRTAHRLGIKTNSTMLYGHIERLDERVDHMRRLRALQDETGGFQVFIPLAFHPEHNMIGKAFPKPTGYDALRTLAVARLYLDNFDHIKAYWVSLGERLAQTALAFGVDDLDGTVLEERIYHMAGSTVPQALSRADAAPAHPRRRPRPGRARQPLPRAQGARRPRRAHRRRPAAARAAESRGDDPRCRSSAPPPSPS